MVEPAATPRIVVRVTPAAKSLVTNSSANRANCATPTGPEITTSVTRSRQTPRVTFGSSASSGNWLATESTAIWASSVPRAISQPGSNSMVIRAEPSEEVAEVLFTPSIPSNAGSTTCTIARSTSSGPAPSHRTLTVTRSIITSGKNCARICGKETAPATSIISKKRFAAVRCRVM